jgi:hypothetical protein
VVIVVDFVLDPDLKVDACGAGCRSIIANKPGISELIRREYELVQL